MSASGINVGDLDDQSGLLSVVVCTYNRADRLSVALESLLALDVPTNVRHELLVVDNGSTDDTPGVVAQWMKTHADRLRYVYAARPGVAAARNRGVAEAKGEWIAFCDDDQCADRRWLRELHSAALRNGVLVAGGAVRLRLPDAHAAIPASVRRIFGETDSRRVAGPYDGTFAPGTGNLLVHRSIFERLGTFDESLVEAGEDTDFFRRLGEARVSAWYQPTAIVDHSVPTERLDPTVLRAACRRIGWGFCRRDRRRHGLVGLLSRAIGRVLKEAVWIWPRYALAAIQRDRPRALGHQVDLWRNGGYLECLSWQLIPGRLARWLNCVPPDFRVEGRAATSSIPCKASVAVSRTDMYVSSTTGGDRL